MMAGTPGPAGLRLRQDPAFRNPRHRASSLRRHHGFVLSLPGRWTSPSQFRAPPPPARNPHSGLAYWNATRCLGGVSGAVVDRILAEGFGIVNCVLLSE